MKKSLATLLSLALVCLILGMASCKKDDPEPTGNPTFVGSAACAECHQEIYDIFVKSGHPYKLNKVINNQQPSIPFTTDEGLQIPTPAGYDWTNITYMIGGYGWKSRFVDENGYNSRSIAQVHAISPILNTYHSAGFGYWGAWSYSQQRRDWGLRTGCGYAGIIFTVRQKAAQI